MSDHMDRPQVEPPGAASEDVASTADLQREVDSETTDSKLVSTSELKVWKVRLTHTAKEMLREITDARIAKKIGETIERLKYEPDKQGNPLVGDLIGYRKIRAVGQRYRVIYTIEDEIVTVFVVAIGLRKEGSKSDVYALARKLLRRGLLEPTEEE